MNDRISYLDFIKGLLVVSIVLIHTVYHSGYDYTPVFLKNIVLAFDVPLFFFITGCIMNVHKKINPLKQIYKLILIFVFIILISQVLYWNMDIKKLLQPIFLKEIDIPQLYILSASYWFVPVYVVSLIYAKIITTFCRKWVSLIILICVPIIYIIFWLFNITIDSYVLGVDILYFLFYLWLMLLGYEGYNYKNNKLWFFIFITSSLYIFMFFHCTPSVLMQDYKFPVKFPYIVLSLLSVSMTMFLYTDIKNNIFCKIGKNALYFYISQGIGASYIYNIAAKDIFPWGLKFLICFIVNLFITILVGLLLSFLYPKFEQLFIKNKT